MIRDVGLSLAMGDTPLGVMAANLGKAGSIMNGGQDWLGRDYIGMARRCPSPNRSSAHCGLHHDGIGFCSGAPEP